MSIIVSLAHGIRFYKVDDQLRNFDNIPTINEVWTNHLNITDCQEFYSDDTFTVQVKQTTSALFPGSAPVMVIVDEDFNETIVIGTLKSTYPQPAAMVFLFWEFPFVMGAYSDKYFIKVYDDDDEYRSNSIQIIPTNENLVILNWYNNDNAFQMDYSTNIVHFIRVPALMFKDYIPGGEISVYNNIGEEDKLREIVTRGFEFMLDGVPAWFSELIRIASSHDVFLINDVEFVRKDIPEVESLGATNLGSYKMTVTQKYIVGLNTHDVGFNCDQCVEKDSVMIVKVEDVTGTGTLTIPVGYQVHTVAMMWKGGSDVSVKVGTSASGDDVVFGERPASGDTAPRTSTYHNDINYTADSLLYYTITGTDAEVDIIIMLLKNTQ